MTWRLAGVIIVVGLGSVGSAHIVEHRAKILAWTEIGGVHSVLPFGFDMAPLGKANDTVKKAHLESCLPAGDYVYCGKHTSIKEARKGCEVLGGRLVQLETEDKNTAVTEAAWAYAEDSFWIDLNDRDTEGEWVWQDGTELDFTRWSEGEPNNYMGNEDCAHANFHRQGIWNDLPCESHQPYVCEFTPPKAAESPCHGRAGPAPMVYPALGCSVPTDSTKSPPSWRRLPNT